MPHYGLVHEFRNKESFEKNYLNMSITDPDVSIHWLFLSRNNDEKDRRYSNENYNWSQILAKNNLTWETIEKSNGVESGAERGTTPNVPTDQIQSIKTWMTLQRGDKISGNKTKEFYKTIPPTLYSTNSSINSVISFLIPFLFIVLTGVAIV